VRGQGGPLAADRQKCLPLPTVFFTHKLVRKKTAPERGSGRTALPPASKKSQFF